MKTSKKRYWACGSLAQSTGENKQAASDITAKNVVFFHWFRQKDCNQGSPNLDYYHIF
jgi:hypothetical protein